MGRTSSCPTSTPAPPSWWRRRATATKRRSSMPSRQTRHMSGWSPRAVAVELLDRVQVPAGLDLGPTSHREIAVAVLAELVQLRAGGALTGRREVAPTPAT